MNPSIELDDLRATWQALDQRLQEQQQLTRLVFREGRLARMRGALRLLAAGQWIQLIAGAALCLLFAPYWIEHWGSAHRVVYGLLLHGYGIMFIAFAVGDLLRISRIDYAAPVVQIQQQLGALAAWRSRCALWFMGTGCLIWVPLMLVIFDTLGADLWVHKPQVVAWFAISGLLALAASMGLVWFARRPGREKLAQALEYSAIGRSLRKARAAVAEVDQFARETTD